MLYCSVSLSQRDWPSGMVGYSLTRFRRCSGQSPWLRRKAESDNSPARECRGFTARVVKKDAMNMKGADREADVIDRLVQWANSQPLVRALLLESSLLCSTGTGCQSTRASK